MSSHRRRARFVAALLAAPALVLGAPSAATAAEQASVTAEEAAATTADGDVEPGSVAGGQIVKKGWWARSNQPPPETGVIAPPSVPALAAPKGSLPVADVAGKPERIAAVEIALEGKEGSTVDSVVLALRESADPTANPNSTAASIVACPITESFWIGAENGPWATAPTYDCTVSSVKGVRDEKGVWRFDLTPLAAGWLAESAELPPAVVLVTGSAAAPGAGETAPAAAPAPSNFQVAFDGAEGLGLLAKTTAPEKSGGNDDEDDDKADDDKADGDDAGNGSGGGTSGAPAGGGVPDLGAGGGAPVDAGPAPDPGAAPALGETAGEEGAATEAAAPVLAPVSAVPWHDGLGRGALLLLPVALLLAYACMLALGPTGQPVADQGRRGVSRALERLRTAGAAVGQGRTRS